MPRLSHEALVQLVRNAPELVLTLLGQTAPDRAARPVHVTAAEFTDLNFAEHRADVVLTIGGTPAAPDEAFVVEIQGEPDPRKRITWPLYVAGARTRLGCPVTLLVLALARWCARPIDLGRGRCVLHPWVLGPADIPIITDHELARAAPELAVLSVAAHAEDPGAEHIALAALAAAHTLDNNRAILYPDFVIALLGAVARAALEKLMATTHYEFQSDFARRYYGEGKTEGKAEGKAETLLKLLQLRGFIVPEAEQARVLACRDLDRLDAWVARVLTARDLDEVLAD